MAAPAASADRFRPDGPYAWGRLLLALGLATIACVGSWSVVVALPEVQREFGTLRGLASLPYACMMAGFAGAAIGLGRLSDRLGIVPPLLIGAAAQGAGYVLAGLAPTIVVFALAHVLVGAGASMGFAPLIAHVSHWFERRRGLAVGIAATGNYLAGALWSPLFQRLIEAEGWRTAHVGVGLFVGVAMAGLAPLFRRRPSLAGAQAAAAAAAARGAGLGVSTHTLVLALALAGFGCCMAMAMPQVHIVAYCADLGYGAARGAEMLSLMLGLGIVSRVLSGHLADRFGALQVLLVGSGMQAAALTLYLFFDGLASLFMISALFGLFQGGIVPMYALVAREYLPPEEAGAKVGILITATIVGMAVGGAASGWIFDWTLSYRPAFLHGLLWNGVNLAVVMWLLGRRRGARLLPSPSPG